jgi:phospholipase D1/2
MADPHQQHLTSAAQPYATYLEGSGNDVKLYELGSDGPDGTSGAFADLGAAIQAAQKFIFICDWSFQPYTRLGPRIGAPQLSQTVGAMLQTQAKAGRLVAVHVWDHTNAGAPDDQNDAAGSRMDDIAKAMGDKGRSSNLLWRKSSRSGANMSFSIHQKYVILDSGGVIKAFFGGLDLTKGRFDWGDHPINYPGASGPLGSQLLDQSKRTYDDFYNAEFTTKQTDWWDQHNWKLGSSEPGDVTMPRQPWQDYYAQIAGPAAWDILREFVGRWNTISLSAMPHGNYSNKDRERVENFFLGLFSDGQLKKPWEDHGGSFTARVVRSIVRGDWGQRKELGVTGLGDPLPCNTPTKPGPTQTEFTWNVPKDYENSIEQSYVFAIQNAKRFVYIESQYFIGSGASWGRPSVGNRIPKTIVDKILDKITHGDDFHAYIVIPMFPEGDAVSGAEPDQRQFEWNTMSFMARTVAKAARAKGKEWTDYLSFYFLANWNNLASVTKGGDRQPRVQSNKRYMVYVHSKLMICDDDYLIVGSANLNERSLAGNRDTEICVYMFADDGKLDAAKSTIQGLRKKAWGEHFGGLPPSWDTPEKASCSSAMQSKGLANWIAFANAKRTDISHLVSWPFEVDSAGTAFYVKTMNGGWIGAQDTFVFDAAADSYGTVSDLHWMWASPLGGAWAIPGSWAE